MKKIGANLALAAAFLAGARTASAQFAELWFSGGKSLLQNRDLGSGQPTGSKSDFQLSDGFRFAFRGTFNTPGSFGHEIFYAYSRTQLRDNVTPSQMGMAVHQAGYNFLAYATKEGKRIRPFGTGGVGFANFVPPGSSVARGGGDTKYGVNYGGGLKVRVASIWAVRVDIRQYLTPKPFNLYLKEGWIRQNELSAGLGVVF